MNRILLLFVFITTFISCSQEQIVLVKNIPSVKVLTLQQILDEAGISTLNAPEIVEEEPINIITNDYVVKTIVEKVETTNYYRIIPSGEEFSISIYYPDTFIILDEVPDEVDYLEEESYSDSGFFMFENGAKDSVIVFKIYDLGGDLEKIINYNITTTQSDNDTEDDEDVDISSLLDDEDDIEIPEISSLNLAEVIIDSLKGLDTSEKLDTLESNLVSVDLTEDEDDQLYREMIDILLDNGRYSDVLEQIENINDEALQDLYYAKYYSDRKKYPKAQMNYIGALEGDVDIEKEAILGLEEMLLDYGNVEETLIENLYTRTSDYETSDEDFYGESLLNIARLYEYVLDVYTAEEIYQTIIDGDFDRKLRKKAESYYEALEDNFLYYK